MVLVRLPDGTIDDFADIMPRSAFRGAAREDGVIPLDEYRRLQERYFGPRGRAQTATVEAEQPAAERASSRRRAKIVEKLRGAVHEEVAPAREVEIEAEVVHVVTAKATRKR